MRDKYLPDITPLRPASGIARAKEVAAFEPTIETFAEAVVRAGGDLKIDVVKAKARSAKKETA
jgi:hypothetical protein